jgi:hypothetical protein
MEYVLVRRSVFSFIGHGEYRIYSAGMGSGVVFFKNSFGETVDKYGFEVDGRALLVIMYSSLCETVDGK